MIDAINAKNVMQQAALTSQNELQKNEFQSQGDSIKAAGHAKAILAEAEAQAKANHLLSETRRAAAPAGVRGSYCCAKRHHHWWRRRHW